MRKYLLILLLLFIPAKAHAQTQIQNLATAPATCTQGQTYFNTTSNSLFVCGPANTWAAAGGGGITQVSSLPATCTPGTPVNLTTPPGGIYVCNSFPAPANTFSRDSSSLNVVDAQVSGVLADGQARFDCTFTNGSPIVTCADAHFLTMAKTGQVVWGNSCNGAANGCGGLAHTTSVTVMGQGTILSIDSDTQIHSTTNANASAAGTATQLLVWGDDDTTALNNAVTAATGTAGACKTLQLSVGMMIVTGGVGNGPYTCQLNVTGGPHESFQVAGYGQVNTVLVPSPNFNFATCTGTGSTCFFGVAGTQFFNFGIWGAELSACGGGQSGKAAMLWGTDNRFLNVEIAGWCAAPGQGFTGLVTNGTFGSAPGASFLTLDGAGSTGISIGSSFFPLSYSFVGDSGDQGVLITGGTFESTGNVYGPVNASSSNLSMVNNNGGVFQSTNDAAYSLNSVTNMAFLRTAPGAFSYLANDSANAGAGTTTKGVYIPGGTVKATNTEFSGTAADVYLDTNGTFIDGGGNRFLGGTINLKAGAATSTWSGVGALAGSCTGVVTSAATVGLYNLGQTAATTCTSTTVGSGQVMSRAGKVYGLYCSATAGNQATDACKVVLNGVAQTMTCSLNAVTSCADMASGHIITYAQGDILSIEVIAGTATTLANVKGILATN